MIAIKVAAFRVIESADSSSGDLAPLWLNHGIARGSPVAPVSSPTAINPLILPVMQRNRYRKFGLVALLSLSGADAMAQALPALRVDPTLLGTPPATKEAAPAEAPVVTPVQQDAVSPVSSTNSGGKKATQAAPTAKRATTADAASKPAASSPSTTPSTIPAAQSVSPGTPPVAAPASGSPMATPAGATSPVVPRPTKAPEPVQVAVARPLPPCVPAPTREQSVELTTPVAVTKLAPLRVDPALLGPAPAKPVIASAPAPQCQDVSSQLAAQPAAARRAGGIALSNLPKGLPRIPIGNPEETTIVANSIRGNNETEVVAEGNVELVKDNALLQADVLVYRQPLDEVEATGNVRLSRETEEISGPYMKLQVKEKTGYFDQPNYVIARNVIGGQKQPKDKTKVFVDLYDLPEPAPKPATPGRGQASRLFFEGEDHYRMEDATFSTCTPDAGGSLDWYTKVANLKLDYTTNVGTGTDTTVYFMNTPILYTPYIEFPLNNARKSGFLAPSIGSSTNTGGEFTQPYYWNIAPNMDATIAPRIMTKRGVQLQNEFRYLDSDFRGQMRAEYLPHDNETGESRSAYNVVHTQNFGNGFNGAVTLAHVSDDYYFRDLSSKLGINNQGLLLNQGVLSYGAGWWSANLLVQDYQVLNTPDNPVSEPYNIKPKLTVNALRADLPGGLQWNFFGEAVNFDHNTNQTGNRVTLYPQISLPIQTSSFFVTPKVGYHQTSYSLDNWNNNGTIVSASSPTRGIPIASVDSGLFMERDTKWAGRSMIQTLEPRLYYVYIPDKNQNDIPLFDTGLPDFNLATIFAENRYVGGDRLGDANQLTGALSSRVIDPDTGAELLRFGFGQRIYFSDYSVKLSPTENTSRTDLLAGFSGQIMPRVFFDTAWQYSQDLSQTERLSAAIRYQPEIGKVLNAAYRFTDPSYSVIDPTTSTGTSNGVKQVDFSGQWPLGGGWYGVGRYNYSFLNSEDKLIEGIAGLEYDGGCWIFRGVLQRAVTAQNDYNTSFFMQLELKDFSRIGTNPMNLLKRSVGGYRDINSLGTDPTFATP